MCKVSVVIPVYNAELYLRECLNSILKQSLNDIEIICIDDGSTDNSVSILKEFAKLDNRIKVCRQSNKGAGAARNIGIQNATGEYFSFLDADDLYEGDMLEKAYYKSIQYDADMCIFNGDYFSEEGFKKKRHWLDKRYINDYELFDVDKKNLLLCTNAAAWNKLFKREFVEQYDLKFQEISWANDMCFTYTALSLADKITSINDSLIHYRVRDNNNLQSLTHVDPVCFCQAFEKIKERLEEEHIYSQLEYGFINAFLNHTVHHLKNFKADEKAYGLLVDCIRYKYAGSFGLLGKEEEYFEEKANYNIFAKEILNIDVASYKKSIVSLEKEVKKLHQYQDKLKNSFSYKIGRGITYLPRLMKKNINDWSKK